MRARKRVLACTRPASSMAPSHWLSAGKPFEVTTLRVDVETYGRKARVAFTDDWQADALRRDFTMNALYCSREGKILDPTDGYQDILRKKVKFVGSPNARIKEDSLRILRFFRFHARYGAGAPDREGFAACVRHKAKLKSLSGERVRQELFKLLEAKRAPDTIKLMAARNVLKVLFTPVIDLTPWAEWRRSIRLRGSRPIPFCAWFSWQRMRPFCASACASPIPKCAASPPSPLMVARRRACASASVARCSIMWGRKPGGTWSGSPGRNRRIRSEARNGGTFLRFPISGQFRVSLSPARICWRAA